MQLNRPNSLNWGNLSRESLHAEHFTFLGTCNNSNGWAGYYLEATQFRVVDRIPSSGGAGSVGRRDAGAAQLRLAGAALAVQLCVHTQYSVLEYTVHTVHSTNLVHTLSRCPRVQVSGGILYGSAYSEY
jgi:hypothetical protein